MNGAQIPISQLADVKLLSGPGMIRDENGRLSGYVYVDVGGRDIGGYVNDAKQAVKEKVRLPVGYTLVWSGQYENMERVAEKLMIVLPIALFIIFLLMYFNTKSAAYTLIILLSLPFSAAGAMWLLYMLGYNLSIPVWVGLIAFLGVDAETSVFMLLYLDMAYDRRKAQGRMSAMADLREAILEGSVERLRPKFMTVAVDFIGLLPVMLATGAGADLTKRIAAPMIAGMFFSFALELFVYPAIYAIWKWHTDVKRQSALNPSSAAPGAKRGWPGLTSTAAAPRQALTRFNSYRDSLARILIEEKLPVEVLSVALVESGFNPLAISPKGARGVWQLMPDTAMRYGLTVAPGNDQRTHLEHATRAAARYLQDLYGLFGDWELALAAYNAGEGRVQRAIELAGARDFNELARRKLLPLETRNYVPAVLAAWSQMSLAQVANRNEAHAERE